MSNGLTQTPERAESDRLRRLRRIVDEAYPLATPDLGPSSQEAATPDDAAFQEWYRGHAERLGLSTDPDDPQHAYDYRAAFRSGAQPDTAGHWPSEFKREGHPNLVVAGRDTRTGAPVDQPPDKTNRLERLRNALITAGHARRLIQ